MQVLIFLLRSPVFWLMVLVLLVSIYYYNKIVNARVRTEEALANLERLLNQKLSIISELENLNIPTNENAARALKQLVQYKKSAPNSSLIEADLNQRAMDYYHVNQQMSAYFHAIPSPSDPPIKQAYENAYQQFSQIEKNLSEAIQIYNKKVGTFNVYIESFPSGILAATLNMDKRQMFV